jgi:LytS/YehU family sensor histidine kinase
MTRLEGHDNDWLITYDSRSVYANLDPGKYTFEVKALLDNELTISSPATLSFEVLTPVFARWWFIALVLIAIIALMWWMIRFREKRLKEIETRQKEKLEFEFQTLKNQINPHFLFNSFSTLMHMIEQEPGVAVEYAEKLSDFFRNILEVRDRELIPVEDELRMLKDYEFIQKKRFGENFIMKIELDQLAMNARIPPLTLQLLTENAIKHNVVSRSRPLKVVVSNDKENIIVTNNLQAKKQAEPSTGLGLKNIKERYLLISRKSIKLETSEDSFKVYLPIIPVS